MDQGTSLRISQPRSTEKRLRKRKELDALVSNMMYTKVKPSNSGVSSNPARIAATRQLLGARHSDTSDTERFAAMEDEDEDDEENIGSGPGALTCTKSNGLTGKSLASGNRKFKAPYTLIRNGRKSQMRSQGLRVFCQCLCYMATALVCALTVAAIFWLHIQLKIQAQDFTTQLKKVLDEKEAISDQHHLFQAQIEALSSNQSVLGSNLTHLQQNVKALIDSIGSLNNSMTIVMKSLEAAPLLKTLPSTVLQVQTEVAELGSKLIDLDSQMSSSQKEVGVSLQNIKDSLTTISNQKVKDQETVNENKYVPRVVYQHLQDSLLNQSSHAESRFESLDSKFKEFATQITDQLQRQETRATKSWELLSQLEDNLQNVSAKALSIQVLCNSNKAKINQIETGLDSQMREIQKQIQHNKEEINLKSLTVKAEEVSTTITTIEDNTQPTFQPIPSKPEKTLP